MLDQYICTCAHKVSIICIFIETRALLRRLVPPSALPSIHTSHTHALRLLCAPFPRAHLHFNCTWFISSDDRASWLMLFVINIRIYIHIYGEACNQWNAPNRFAQAGASQQPSPADWCLLWWAPPVSVCVCGVFRAHFLVYKLCDFVSHYVINDLRKATGQWHFNAKPPPLARIFSIWRRRAFLLLEASTTI